MHRSGQTPPARQRAASSDTARQPLKVRELLGDEPVVELDHDGQIYRLRITRNRKLILTK